MRFHIPSIPHTITSKEHSACAFTQNIVNFCAMMSRRGHEIIHYGHRNSKVECAELVAVIEPEHTTSCTVMCLIFVKISIQFLVMTQKCTN